MQMSRMLPFEPGRMQACMRLSLDSRLGKSAGTTTLPCRVVTNIPPRPLACAGVLNTLAVAGAGSISAFSTGAQSMAWQHSIGYQSWAAAGVIAASAAARNHFLDMPVPRCVSLLLVLPGLRFPLG